MDISQWPQGMGLGGITTEQRRPRPQQEQALNCPRCNSANTKFCYYNNYSLSQPRYFCKACRRYWTVGGSLRNVPVGGSSRKHKRPSPSTPSSSKISHPVSESPKTHQGQDLNLAYPPSTSDFNNINPSPNPFGNATYSCGLISQQEIKPIGLGFCLEGFGNGYGSRVEGVEETSAARVFFPFEELKQAPSRRDDQFGENLKGQGGHSSTGYWTGMLGGGSNW